MTYVFGTIGGGLGSTATKRFTAVASLEGGHQSSEFCTAGASILPATPSHPYNNFSRDERSPRRKPSLLLLLVVNLFRFLLSAY